ncbi:MAG: hypothetical protein KJI69_04945 [Patescibacteria group bacterium]|nr:hypothetical protein [Patescibacteria group bacterium]
MRKEGEVETKTCSQCKGYGEVSKVYSYGAIRTRVQCPVCDGYGFVIIK